MGKKGKENGKGAGRGEQVEGFGPPKDFGGVPALCCMHCQFILF